MSGLTEFCKSEFFNFMIVLLLGFEESETVCYRESLLKSVFDVVSFLEKDEIIRCTLSSRFIVN